MKRIITITAVIALVVACFCVPLVASAEYVTIGDPTVDDPTIVSSVYDYGLVYGYWDRAEIGFTSWCALSSFEFTLADHAFRGEDVSVTLSSPISDVELELHYYPNDVYHIWTLLSTPIESDPILDTLWVWKFDDPIVLPDLLLDSRSPIANCSLPLNGDPSVVANVAYSFEYFDGDVWAEDYYSLPIGGTDATTVNLFPSRADSRLIRNLTTTITFEDTYVEDYYVGVTEYGMPYYIGEKTNYAYYTDPISYSLLQYGVIDGSSISFTGFLGNALSGVFDAPLFAIGEFEFSIGGILGVCVGMGVLLLVLKKFAGG